MVDTRFSQIVKQVSGSSSNTQGVLSQIVKQVSYTKLPVRISLSQIIKQVSYQFDGSAFTHVLSQIVKQVSFRVPPIGTACEVEPITGTTSFFGLIDADWIEEVEMDTTWLTDVAASKVDLAEDRLIAQRRPTREIKVALSGASQQNATRLAKYLARLGHNKNAIPLWQDRRTLLVTATSGATNELRIDTSYRRFYRGQHVGVARPDGLQINNLDVLILTIDAVASDRLYLTANVPATLQAGWDVYPMIDVDLVQQSQMTLASDYYGRSVIQALELSGCNTLPASSGEDVSALFPYVDDYPVLDVGPNWRDNVSFEVHRTLETFHSGRTSGSDPSGARAVEVFDFEFGPCDREAFWKMLQFHDSRRGRGRPFWVLHPQTLWTFIGSGLDYVDVRPVGYADDIPEFFSHVAFVEADGTITILPITSATVETSPARHRIHVTGLPPASVDRVTAAVLCREDSDSLHEVWTNEEVCSSLKIKCRGLLAEGVVSLG